MKIVRGERKIDGVPFSPENFTGPGGIIEVLMPPVDAGPWAVFVINAKAGSRTKWHSHSGPQFMFIVSGRGYIQMRGEEMQRLEPGDMVVTEPNEVHWHGAGPDLPVQHVTISAGGQHPWYEETDIEFPPSQPDA